MLGELVGDLAVGSLGDADEINGDAVLGGGVHGNAGDDDVEAELLLGARGASGEARGEGKRGVVHGREQGGRDIELLRLFRVSRLGRDEEAAARGDQRAILLDLYLELAPSR